MFRIIRNIFLILKVTPKRDTPVAPLGLEGIGIPMCYTPAAPLGLWGVGFRFSGIDGRREVGYGVRYTQKKPLNAAAVEWRRANKKPEI